MQTPIIETDEIANPNALHSAATPKRVAGVVPRAYWTAKAGNAATDYEDAYAIGVDCLAIADGATESSFARLWASALAEGFVSDPSAVLPCTTERLQEWARPLQTTWTQAVPWNTLPWFAEDKARSGAFATLVGFQFQPDAQTWRAFAIGDSCFFLIRAGALKQAFPLEHSSQFDSRPILLSSNPANNKRVWNDVVVMDGAYHVGDILVFATDALAKWLLARAEAGERPWDALCGLSSQEEFETFVTRLRHDRVMRNDDVTLVIVEDTRPIVEPETPSALASMPEPALPALYAGTPSEPSPPEERTPLEPSAPTAPTSDANGIILQETGLTLAMEHEQEEGA